MDETKKLPSEENDDRPAKRHHNDGETHDDTLMLDSTIRMEGGVAEQALQQLETDLQQLTKELEQCEKKILNCEDEIVSLSGEIKKVQTEKQESKATIGNLKNLKHRLDQDFSNLDSPEALAALRSQDCNSYDDLLKKINREEDRIIFFEKEVVALRDEKADLRNKEADLRDEKAALRNEKAALQKQKSILLEMKIDKKVAPYRETRLANIDYRINNKMSHTFDLNRFLERINEVFHFFENDNYETVMAPYFPMVQSSGMGKTKLLREAFKELNKADSGYRCRMLICTSAVDVQNLPEIYRESALQLIKPQGQLRDHLCQQLDAFLYGAASDDARTDSKPFKVVIFIDEAQLLLVNDGFAFRCVRWWLRIRRTNSHVVAVLAGTSSALANFYREDPPSQSSRDPGGTYYNENFQSLRLYEPFFDLCTIGIISPDTMVSSRKDKEKPTSYDLAVPCGRPLFALLHQDNALDISKEHTILKKMLLSPTNHAVYQEDLQACLAILGTRVQMGQTSFLVASRLVGKGYAILTSFSRESDVAYIAYPPDPVCSRLAMCLMDPDWSLWPTAHQTQANTSSHEAARAPFKGCAPTTWAQQAMTLVSTGLCRPHKGNVGEVAVALLLLLCGDRLRRKIDRDYRHFAVPLDSWVDELLSLDQDPDKDPVGDNDSQNPAAVPTISFIQVCRNHFRTPFEKMLGTEALEWSYKAGCACYSYKDCEAFDMYAAIKIPGETPQYVPLLVSVKNHCSFSDLRARNELDSMCCILDKTDHEMALCVLVVIGLNDPQKITSGWQEKQKIRGGKGVFSRSPEPDGSTRSSRQGKKQKIGGLKDPLSHSLVPDRLTRGFWSRLVISVPSKDPFGLSNLATAPSMDGDEHAEVYASQGFLHPYAQSSIDSTIETDGLLRKQPGESVKAYAKGMTEAFAGMWSSRKK